MRSKDYIINIGYGYNLVIDFKSRTIGFIDSKRDIPVIFGGCPACRGDSRKVPVYQFIRYIYYKLLLFLKSIRVKRDYPTRYI